MPVLLDLPPRSSPVLGRRPRVNAAADAPQPSELEREEAALMVAVGRGDRDRALPELYRRYERRLFGLGIRLLGDAGLAEELVQETFIRLWRTADRFDPARGTVTAFVLSIARRLAIDLWRRPSSRRAQPEAEPAAPVEETIDRLLLQFAVRDALDSLPQAQREVLELSYYSDLTQTEVASRLRIPLGTVKSRAYHALRAFHRAAEERGIDG
jgi:RNA polymerase sigma-70 factor, ECF subfamily